MNSSNISGMLEWYFFSFTQTWIWLNWKGLQKNHHHFPSPPTPDIPLLFSTLFHFSNGSRFEKLLTDNPRSLLAPLYLWDFQSTFWPTLIVLCIITFLSFVLLLLFFGDLLEWTWDKTTLKCRSSSSNNRSRSSLEPASKRVETSQVFRLW